MFPLSVARPFRKVNEKGVLLWDKIHKLQKGQIYKQVSRDPSVLSVAVLCGQLEGQWLTLVEACHVPGRVLGAMLELFVMWWRNFSFSQ